MPKDKNKVCFIISHKYFRGYKSYLKYYINNIQKFYPEALTIVVDNNSVHGDDIFDTLQGYKNIVILTNESESKFEIGAYCEGIRYLFDNNIINKRGSRYEYYIFTQDTYIIKNKYDFKNHQDMACALHAAKQVGYQGNFMGGEVAVRLLSQLNIDDPGNCLKQAWCSSFILHKSKVRDFLEIVGDAVLTVRRDSECGERYLSAILYSLNDNKISDIDTEPIDSLYDACTIDLEEYQEGEVHYFMKSLQQKTENTKDDA